MILHYPSNSSNTHRNRHSNTSYHMRRKRSNGGHSSRSNSRGRTKTTDLIVNNEIEEPFSQVREGNPKQLQRINSNLASHPIKPSCDQEPILYSVLYLIKFQCINHAKMDPKGSHYISYCC